MSKHGETANGKKGLFVPDEFLDDAAKLFGPSPLLTYLRFSRRINEKRGDGECWPLITNEALAQDVSPRTIRRHVDVAKGIDVGNGKKLISERSRGRGYFFKVTTPIQYATDMSTTLFEPRDNLVAYSGSIGDTSVTCNERNESLERHESSLGKRDFFPFDDVPEDVFEPASDLADTNDLAGNHSQEAASMPETMQPITEQERRAPGVMSTSVDAEDDWDDNIDEETADEWTHPYWADRRNRGRFDLVFTRYPNRGRRAVARAAWRETIGARPDIDVLLAEDGDFWRVLDTWKVAWEHGPDWRVSEPKFIPFLATYLTNRQWALPPDAWTREQNGEDVADAPDAAPALAQSVSQPAREKALGELPYVDVDADIGSSSTSTSESETEPQREPEDPAVLAELADPYWDQAPWNYYGFEYMRGMFSNPGDKLRAMVRYRERDVAAMGDAVVEQLENDMLTRKSMLIDFPTWLEREGWNRADAEPVAVAASPF